MSKPTENELILKCLAESGKFMAVHEMEVMAHSQNSISTRLSELAKAGLVVGRYRSGFRYKEWALIKQEAEFEGEQRIFI